MWHTKTSKVTDIFAENIRNNLQYELRSKVFDLIRSDIEQIVKETAADLIDRIESYNEIDGTITINVHVKQPKENEAS